MGDYLDVSARYADSARSVSANTDLLLAALAASDGSDIEFAANTVLRATERYAGDGERYQQFRFDNAPQREVVAAGTAGSERMQRDMLASALLDLSVAQTVVAAGAALEDPTTERIEQLKNARAELDDSSRILSAGLTRPLDAPAADARFAFDAMPVPSTVSSRGEAEAKAALKKRVDEAGKTLVEYTSKVLEQAYKSLKRLNVGQIVEVLNELGASLNVPETGELFKKGLELSRRALNTLSSVIASDSLESVRQRLNELLKKFTGEETLIGEFLSLTFQLHRAEQRVDELLNKATATPQKMDRATNEIGDLESRFTERMLIVSRILAISGGARLIAGFFVPENYSTAVFGSICLLSMNYAVLTAMDFADAPGPLNFVEGLVKISERQLA